MNALPSGKFGCILADPPWRFATFSPKGRGRCPDGILTPEQMRNLSRQNNPERHYATMSLDEIKDLPVDSVAAKDCLLMMWAVDPLLPEALEVGKAWGFKFKTVGFVWAKERRVTSNRAKDMEASHHKQFPMGTGYWTRANPELRLLFTKGKPKRLSASVRKLLIAPRREHSRKPDRQYEDIEQLVAGPYLELFARTERDGWSSWGYQVGKFAPANDNSPIGDLFAKAGAA